MKITGFSDNSFYTNTENSRGSENSERNIVIDFSSNQLESVSGDNNRPRPKKSQKKVQVSEYLVKPENPFSRENLFKDFLKPLIDIKFPSFGRRKYTDKRYGVPSANISARTGESYIRRANNPEQFKNIPKSYAPYIKRVAKNTGMSEYFIRHLLSTEHFIPKARDIGDGVLTIGFGHTNNADHNTNFHKGDTISLATAFQWFEQDIKDQQGHARTYFTPTEGKYKGKFRYDSFPQSFKEALIDVAFNRGSGAMASDTIYNSLRANLGNGAENMPAAAVRTRQETFSNPKMEAGLRKRNVYRFLLAIRSLSGKQQLAAMKRFDRDERDKNGNLIKSYYTKTLDMLPDSISKQVKRDWNAVKKAAEYKAQRGR